MKERKIAKADKKKKVKLPEREPRSRKKGVYRKERRAVRHGNTAQRII